MSQPPRIFLITNDGPRAALIFWCHMGNLPPGIVIVDDPWKFAAVPNGSKCRAFWFGNADVTQAWETLWWERKGKGGIEGISEEEWAAVQAWADVNRKRPTILLLHGADDPRLAEPVGGLDASRPAPSAPAPQHEGEKDAPAVRPSPPHAEVLAKPASKDPSKQQPDFKLSSEPVKRKSRWT
jgi:hypothetical protein